LDVYHILKFFNSGIAIHLRILDDSRLPAVITLI
jgi:hypothetical protein